MADSFFTELKRRNVIRVGVAYLAGSWLLVEVADTLLAKFGYDDSVIRFLIIVIAIGLIPVLIFSWVYEFTSEGIVKESEITQTKAVSLPINQKLDFLIIGLLVISTGYFIWESRFESKTELVTANTSNEVVNSIAVLPFVNMSSDPEQEYFSDGLTEELLNSLAKIHGLKVVGRTSSFAFKDKNIDLREIAKQLNVQYIVEGSVRKSGEYLRITMQLIEAENGTHLLSETFDRKLVNVFALQDEISQLVAAALKLTIIHKDDRYNSALSSLDYIAVEQLITARALINEYASEPIKSALNTLNALNNKYPNTPEVIGLIARANVAHRSVGESLISEEKNITMAQQAMQLDRKNRDALLTLAAIYDDYPQTIKQALIIRQDLLRYYPADLMGYIGYFKLLIIMNNSCEELQAFLQTVPEGIFDVRLQQRLSFMIEHCLTPKLAEDKLLSTDYKYLANNSRAITDADWIYGRMKKRIMERNLNQRRLTYYYRRLLTLGAKESAAEIYKQIDLSKPGYWPIQITLQSYIYNIPTPKKPLDLIDDIAEMFRNRTYLYVSVGLAKQSYQEERTEELRAFLDSVPEFPIGLMNLEFSIGLMALQYYSGEQALAKQTANQISDEMTDFKLNHPATFAYRRLGHLYFIAAFYSDNQALAQQILDENFKENDASWGFLSVTGGNTVIYGYGVMEFLLMPWKNNPTVIEYLNSMAKDRQRARQEFDLK
ncbi:MAG: TolB-like protein/adenylate kinase family enzyme [Enterobacterales bacterium]